MKFITPFIISLFFSHGLKAQVMDAQAKKTDTIAQKVILFLKKHQPDSIYAMAGKVFSNEISAESFNSICVNQLFPLNNFENVSYNSSANEINSYKVEGTPTLQLLVGLDSENKIQTLLIKPYVED